MIAKARVPIVKFVEKESGIAFDIRFVSSQSGFLFCFFVSFCSLFNYDLLSPDYSFDVQNGPKAAEFITVCYSISFSP